MQILLPASATCSCHIIDPYKVRVLLWKRSKDNAETYLLKIAEQRFIGSLRTDKNNEPYWKFRNFTGEEADLVEPKLEETKLTEPPEKAQPEASQASEPTAEKPSPEKDLDPVAKFHQRQAKH